MDATEVVEKHARQVHAIAHKMGNHTAVWDHDDMAQEGFIGLLDAAERHDPEKASLFTLAAFRIRGQISDAKRAINPVPRSMAAKGFAHARQEASLDEPIDFYLPFNKGDLLADERAVDPAEAVASEAMAEVVRELLDLLTGRERQVMQLYFYEEMPLEAIGELLGVTESRVCQIKAKALQRMRSGLRLQLSDAE